MGQAVLGVYRKYHTKGEKKERKNRKENEFTTLSTFLFLSVDLFMFFSKMKCFCVTEFFDSRGVIAVFNMLSAVIITIIMIIALVLHI